MELGIDTLINKAELAPEAAKNPIPKTAWYQ